MNGILRSERISSKAATYSGVLIGKKCDLTSSQSLSRQIRDESEERKNTYPKLIKSTELFSCLSKNSRIFSS